MAKIITFTKSIAIPVLVGIIVSFLIADKIDYNSLIKPFGAPPSLAFPIVWTILYILMGISYGILETNKENTSEIKLIYYLQLGVNAFWSIFFFLFKWRFFSIIWIIFLDILVYIMIKLMKKENLVAGLIQIPYLIWTLYATYLTIAIFILN